MMCSISQSLQGYLWSHFLPRSWPNQAGTPLRLAEQRAPSTISGISAAARDKIFHESELTQRYFNILVRDDQGKPNPRVSCTSGNFDVRKRIAKELADLGLHPLGANGSFEWRMNGTSTDGCEQGIANVIGYVKGSELPDEFLMWVAHYDGPNNQGPSRTSQGNRDTDDAYDDASSVAVGISLAATLAKDPPKLSVIFFFSDAEEGWDNVGTSPLGSKPGELTDVAKKLCTSSWMPAPNASKPCSNYPIGFYSWSQSPSVDLQKVRLLLDADPLGAPGVAGSDFVAVVGAESSRGLQDLLAAYWPSFDGATKPIFANRNYAKVNYDDIDPVTATYSCNRSSVHCLPDKGIPYVWLAQPGFQHYHGGQMAPITALLAKFGKYVLADFSSLTPYYALDDSAGFHPEVLDRTFATLLPLLRALANSPRELQSLRYDGSVYRAPYTLRDAMNNKAIIDHLIDALSKGSAVTYIPDDATKAFLRLLRAMSIQLWMTLTYYNSNPWYWRTAPEAVYPGYIFQQLAPLIFAVTSGIDFYSVADPNKQVYVAPGSNELQSTRSLRGLFEELKELRWD